MSESGPASTGHGSGNPPLVDPRVDELLPLLGSGRWADRRGAEDALRDIGPAAVPSLVNALHGGSDEVRWGAVKVLGEIADPSAAPALIEALEDTNGGVRWLAAQALVAVGASAVVPLLRRLLSRADSPWLQEGAHHVLRSLGTPALSPVIRALEDRFPGLTVPLVANEALKEMEPGRP